MKLSSSQLEAFYVVAQTRNFTKAAELIFVSQSALSQRIANLEAEIQTSLFIRDRKGIELTEVGVELLKYCQFQENLENEFLGKLKTKNSHELAGIIRVAGFSSVMRSVIVPSLRNLLVKNTSVKLQSQTKELHELWPMLKSGEADFIILDHKIEREGIESVELGYERNVLVAPKNYSGPQMYLDHDEHDETTHRYLKLAKKSEAKIARHFLDDIYGIIDGVKTGLGMAVLPEHMLSETKGVEIRNPKVALEVPIVVHFYKQPFYTRLHSAVLQSLVSEAPDYLALKMKQKT
jgi:DNA-binding transcriptional LysR family regulator